MVTLMSPSCDAGVSAWEALCLMNSIIACISVPSLPDRKCTIGEWWSCLVLHAVCLTHVGCMHCVYRETGMSSVVCAAIESWWYVASLVFFRNFLIFMNMILWDGFLFRLLMFNFVFLPVNLYLYKSESRTRVSDKY